MRRLGNFVERQSGLVVPFRSFPGEQDHQGVYGPEAIMFLQVMQSAGFSVLHDLPSTPPDGYNCPYSSVSTFALDPQRIGLEYLAETRDVDPLELKEYQRVIASGDYSMAAIKDRKEQLLKSAFVKFDESGDQARKAHFDAWRGREADWLDSYAAFEILKAHPQNKNKPWQEWQVGKDCSKQLIERVKAAEQQKFLEISYMQWVAEEQTLRFLKTAETLGIEVWGDVPFYVGDGEVWANRRVFNLDADGRQVSQGGAPPSDTSAIGQKWGNATYAFNPADNPERAEATLDWWTRRLIRAEKLSLGKVRLDHFIGIAEPYIMRADAVDGAKGWREDGVGAALFDRLVTRYGNDLPFYPEDLGEMTHKTPELRDKYGLLTSRLAVRGLTKHLAMGIDEYETSPNNPLMFSDLTVGFTSNHDSPTLVQTFEKLRKSNPREFAAYVDYANRLDSSARLSVSSSSVEVANHEMGRVMQSVASYALIGAWDLLHLGAEARYNVPATIDDANWSWRFDGNNMRLFQAEAKTWRALNDRVDRTVYGLAA